MKKNRVTELLRGDGTLDEARGTGLTGKQFLYRFVYIIRVQGMKEVLELVPTKVSAHMDVGCSFLYQRGEGCVTRERPLGSSSLAYLPRPKNMETLEAQEAQN
jgi:hypothetical protein